MMRLLHKTKSATDKGSGKTLTTVPSSVFAKCPFCNIYALVNRAFMLPMSDYARLFVRGRETHCLH